MIFVLKIVSNLHLVFFLFFCLFHNIYIEMDMDMDILLRKPTVVPTAVHLSTDFHLTVFWEVLCAWIMTACHHRTLPHSAN